MLAPVPGKVMVLPSENPLQSRNLSPVKQF